MFAQSHLLGEMPKLQKFSYKLCQNRDDAEDLLQATLLRALEKSDLFEDNTNLFSWCAKIMYNLFVTRYRHQVKYGTQYNPDFYIQNHKTPPRQEQLLELGKVTEAMESLTDEHKQILIMVCVKGMKYKAVSETLDIPVGTVRSRLSRAREKLSEALNNEETLVSAYHHSGGDYSSAFRISA